MAIATLQRSAIARRPTAAPEPPLLPRKKASVRIGLLGPYGFGNLGDASIQDAMIQNIRTRISRAEIAGFSLNPDDTSVRHRIPAYPITRRPPPPARRTSWIQTLIYKANLGGVSRVLYRICVRAPMEVLLIPKAMSIMRHFDALIISGGGQLDDYWGGALVHPYTLLKWTIAARLARAKVFVVSVGAGPIRSRLSQFFIKRCLSLAHYRSYRDEASRLLLARIGFQRDDPVYPDLAFSLDRTRKWVGSYRAYGRLTVGVGPMAYFNPLVWPERDDRIYREYLKKMALFTAWLLENGHGVHLFQGEHVHDRWATDDFKVVLGETAGRKALLRVIDTPTATVNALLTVLGHTDIVVASRYHGVLLAHFLAKPVLAVSYHEKIDVLMKNVGQSDLCVDIRTFTPEDLRVRFTRMIADADRLTRDISDTVDHYRAELDRQYDLLFGPMDHHEPEKTYG